MTKKSRSWKEGAGIYDVLENRGNLVGKSAWDMAGKGGIYGWAHRNDKMTDQLKLKATTQGLITGISSSFDYSGGAYFWQGNDFAKHYSGMSAYEDFYLVGFKFTDQKHNLWNMSNHLSGNAYYNYMFESTGGENRTIFFKYTNEYRERKVPKYHSRKQWP